MRTPTTARTPARSLWVLTAGVCTVLALAGCTATPPTSSSSSGAASSLPAPSGLAAGEVAPVGTPTDVVTGLDAPWSVILAGTTPLISERDSGQILEVRPDGSTRSIGTVPGVAPAGEAGLLGLSLDDQQRLYVYSTADTGNRIQRFALEGTPGNYRLGTTATTILDRLPSNTFHDGGRIAFGPEGMLYATVGDAGASPDAQDRTSLAGIILRMTPEGGVPDDNPFPGSLVYTLGHRNVQGLGWAADGTMFAAEFGANTWDELNIIEAGHNYGWPNVEGQGGGTGFTDPVQQWATQDASPSGLTVIDNTIFIANLRGEVLRGIPVSDPSTSHEYLKGQLGRLRTVLPSPDGNLWILTNNTDSRGTPRQDDDRLVSINLP